PFEVQKDRYSMEHSDLQRFPVPNLLVSQPLFSYLLENLLRPLLGPSFLEPPENPVRQPGSKIADSLHHIPSHKKFGQHSHCGRLQIDVIPERPHHLTKSIQQWSSSLVVKDRPNNLEDFHLHRNRLHTDNPYAVET